MNKLVKLSLIYLSTLSVFATDMVNESEKAETKSKDLGILDKEIKYKNFDNIDGSIYSSTTNQIFTIISFNEQKKLFNSWFSTESTDGIKSKKDLVKDDERIKKNFINQEIKDKIEQESRDRIEREEKEKKRSNLFFLEDIKEKESIESSKKGMLVTSEKLQLAEIELGATTLEGKKEVPKVVDTPILKNKSKINSNNTSRLLAEIKSRVEKKSNEIDANYDRSSLYTLMITNSAREYESDIKSYFENKLTPDKYNNHNLDERFITSAFKKKDQLDNIVDYLNEKKIAQQLIAKWFNRSQKGGFNLDLIKQRGYYDASASKINQAKYAKRGMSQLINPEVVKKLLDNTFILVIDSKYTNKEKIASVGKSVLSLLGNLPGASYVDQLTSIGGGLVLDTFGKGYWVSTNAHLFKLVWNDEIDSRFFTELWCDDVTVTTEKRKAFDNADFFALDYIGTDQTGADVQSTAFTKKTNGELVGRATVKSIENVITKLQENYDVFKTKTPIYTSEPLTAKIGLKEGVTKKTKFEVLEQQLTDNGTLEFVQVGSVKVDSKFQIWDNRYGADEENPNQGIDKTYFKTTSGKEFAPGMLLRQIK